MVVLGNGHGINHEVSHGVSHEDVLGSICSDKCYYLLKKLTYYVVKGKINPWLQHSHRKSNPQQMATWGGFFITNNIAKPSLS